MKKANFLLLWVLLAIAIVIMVSNGWQLAPHVPIELPDSVAGDTLFICPAADSFVEFARQLGLFRQPLNIMFMFFLMLWLAITAWTLYQSLLKDKFEQKSYQLPIFLAKFLIFAAVLFMVFLKTPNYFRGVIWNNNNEQWVMCESDTPGARAVSANDISAGKK